MMSIQELGKLIIAQQVHRHPDRKTGRKEKTEKGRKQGSVDTCERKGSIWGELRNL